MKKKSLYGYLACIVVLITSCSKNYSPVGNYIYQDNYNRGYDDLILRSDYSLSLSKYYDCNIKDEKYSNCADHKGQGKWSLIDKNLIMTEITIEMYNQEAYKKLQEDFYKSSPFTAHLLPPMKEFKQEYSSYTCYYRVENKELIPVDNPDTNDCHNYLKYIPQS